jgi:hypothetical protein
MLAKPEISHFKCPHCGAGYNVVRVEAEPKWRIADLPALAVVFLCAAARTR